MKKINYIIFTLFTFFTLNIVSYAAGTATLSVGSSSIENGKSVTASVTAKNVAAWNVNITSSGSTGGCSQKFVGDSGTGNNTTKTFSVTCKSTSTGIINFVMSGDITSSDGVNTKISGSKSVNVVTPRAKSTNNKLSSLSITGYTLTPSFDSDVNEYSVNVPSTVESITINANKDSSYASITGTGEKTVSEGTNNFQVTVTSESGETNTYKITVNVEDLNPVDVDIDGKKYTVVKENKNLVKPDLFDETTVNINGISVPAFINDVVGYTLVGLKDNNGNISLYIYENNKYSLYKQNMFDQLTLYILSDDIIVPEGYMKTTIKIGDNDITVYKSDLYDMPLIYAINLATGEKNLYKYDVKENTIQRYENIDNSKEDLYFKVIAGLFGFTVLSYIIFIIIISSNKKKSIKKVQTKIESKDLPDEEKNEILKTMSIDIGGIKAEVKKRNENKKVSKKELRKQTKIDAKNKKNDMKLKLKQDENLKRKIILEEKNRKKDLKKNDSNDDMATL